MSVEETSDLPITLKTLYDQMCIKGDNGVFLIELM